MISILVPYHDLDVAPSTADTAFFLKRNLDSIMSQTYTDYEVVHIKKGSMPETANEGIKRCRGDIIKLLPQDDYFYHKDALQRIVDAFTGGWLATGCTHHNLETGVIGNEHLPTWNDRMLEGHNTLGGLSIIAFKNDKENPIYFDENLSWLIDVDFYHRLHEKYGEPVFLNDINVANGIHREQMTHKLSAEFKLNEEKYVREKYNLNS